MLLHSSTSRRPSVSIHQERGSLQLRTTVLALAHEGWGGDSVSSVRSTASMTMDIDIFEKPTRRSMNTRGTSTRRPFGQQRGSVRPRPT